MSGYEFFYNTMCGRTEGDIHPYICWKLSRFSSIGENRSDSFVVGDATSSQNIMLDVLFLKLPETLHDELSKFSISVAWASCLIRPDMYQVSPIDLYRV